MFVELTKQDNLGTLLIENKYVVAYFTASWCGPCKAYGPTFKKVADETDALFVKIDADEFFELGQLYGIRAVPTTLFIEDGKVLITRTGAVSFSALRQDVQQLLVN